MPYWIWIIVAVVVLALIGLTVGLLLGRRRRVSLTAPTAQPAPDAKPPAKGGGYKAGGSISFSAGAAAGAATLDRPPAPGTAPVEPSAKPSEGPSPASDAGSPGSAPTVTEPPDTAEPVAPATPGQAASASPDGTALVVPAEPGGAVTGQSRAPTPATSESESGVGPVTADLESRAEPVTAGPAAQDVAGPNGLAGSVAVAGEIEPTAGRLSRLRGRLSRSQSVFGRSLLGLLGAGDLDEDSWQEIEDTLLMADLGSSAALEITQKLRDQVAARGVADPAAARAMLRSVLIDAVDAQADRSVRALPHDGRPAVALVVGVNGTGKTTTTGKLARVLVADGRRVVLGAADTFRAAAADQLATWGEQVGATVIRGAERADPAAVAYDAVRRGIDAGADAVLIDTAGRLHTKTGLMDELGKVKRVVEKLATVDEVLLVLDATTGQNGLVQAKVFAEVVDVSGIVLTKLDGTAKGGIVVAVQRALGVPVKLVGLGEGPDDLAPFEAAAFVDALLGD